jgi:ribonuclease HII
VYAGVDEAGRGPVLGPLVVAGVLADPQQLPDGVDDSKNLAPGKRRTLLETIEADATVTVRSIPTDELNERMSNGQSLDEIEIDAFAHVLEQLDPDEAITDAVGSDPDALGDTLTDRAGVPVRAGTEADARDPVVGAASIVAKVHRDRAMDEIAEELGIDVGSGYPSDPTTRAFLADRREASRQIPPHTRSAWSTIKDMGFGQPRLDEYDNGGET